MALPSRVFCDTSFFYACFDVDDTNHDRAEELADEAARSGVSFLATWDIISETITLLRYRLGSAPALSFLQEVKPTLSVVTMATWCVWRRKRFFADEPASNACPSATQFRS